MFMSQANSLTIENFQPSPGFILLERLEDKSNFKDINEADNPCYKAKVLKVGDVTVENGDIKDRPCKIGDTVLYKHSFGLPELEIDFIKYPVPLFSQIIGVFE